MRTLSRDEIEESLARWQQAWNRHDLEGVMALIHDQVLFETWSGARVKGKARLRRAWSTWFAEHGGFEFAEEETFIDETGQKALFRWQLRWPSPEEGYKGETEHRKGVDVLHFEDGKIIRKLTYSKTTVQIDGATVPLLARQP